MIRKTVWSLNCGKEIVGIIYDIISADRENGKCAKETFNGFVSQIRELNLSRKGKDSYSGGENADGFFVDAIK